MRGRRSGGFRAGADPAGPVPLGAQKRRHERCPIGFNSAAPDRRGRPLPRFRKVSKPLRRRLGLFLVTDRSVRELTCVNSAPLRDGKRRRLKPDWSLMRPCAAARPRASALVDRPAADDRRAAICRHEIDDQPVVLEPAERHGFAGVFVPRQNAAVVVWPEIGAQPTAGSRHPGACRREPHPGLESVEGRRRRAGNGGIAARRTSGEQETARERNPRA